MWSVLETVRGDAEEEAGVTVAAVVTACHTVGTLAVRSRYAYGQFTVFTCS